MKVILTHEQADMDALASLLGAWLLQPDALPVLPRNINRNGRRFIKRYADQLPFIEQKDLPKEEITEILLVDTQSLITLKGMSEQTKVVVYDHHPQREDLNPAWEAAHDPIRRQHQPTRGTDPIRRIDADPRPGQHPGNGAL